MTINNGYMGIGIQYPQSMLSVAGGVQIGNDVNTTMLVDEVFDAGGLRYRCSWFTKAYELAGGVFPECSLRSASMKRK